MKLIINVKSINKFIYQKKKQICFMMRAKKSILSPYPIIPPILKNDSLKDSLFICSIVTQEILSKIIKQLPPDPQLLLQYSGIVVKNTTQKLVDVTMLKSQTIYCPSDRSEILSNSSQSPSQQFSQKQTPQQKKNSFKAQGNQNSNQICTELSKSGIRQFKVKKPFKLKQDHDIHLKKDGIKILKRQQLKNIVHHRNSNQHNSLHEWPNKPLLKGQKIGTKHSIHQNLHQSGDQNLTNTKNHVEIVPQNQHNPITNKSTKSLSTLPGIQKASWSSKVKDKPRISGVLNNTQFVNLKDYYRQKGNRNSNQFKNTNYSINNQSTLNKSQLSNHMTTVQQNLASDSVWQFQKQVKKIDEADAMINKLRERKQKFYRTGINYSNGESFVNTKRSNTLIMNPNQKGNSANNQFGAMVMFDYSGQIMPTFKYETIKMQSHYQQMEFTVGQNQDQFSKKKQRRGHMFRAAINLKLVDHQKFIPHPQYKYEPLVEKIGTLMQESTANSLKKGVELKAKEENSNGQSKPVLQSDQNREKLNRSVFEFLHNEQIGANKIKYQDFMRYKNESQSAISVNKSPSSRKKLSDQKNELILSKKSIVFKGLKGKQSKHEDSSNKIYKSENRKALQLLVNSAHNTICEFSSVKENIDEEKEKENVILNGILNKKGHYVDGKSQTNVLGQNHPKKKVRIT